MRITRKYLVPQTESFKKKLFLWVSEKEICCYFDSNQYSEKVISPVSFNSYECLAAIGTKTIMSKNISGFDLLKKYYNENKDWLFGYISYDMKNYVENLASQNHDGLEFPVMYFFCPELVFHINENELTIEASGETDTDAIFEEIQNKDANNSVNTKPINITARVQKDDYLDTVEKIKSHIQWGDIYEMNYCIEFFDDNANINPRDIFIKLNAVSPVPYAAYFRINDKYILSASPERYLKKTGNKIISQPIKGTIRRSSNTNDDIILKKQLSENPKERSENIMIVDLVRNDLTQTAVCGSVKVDELCKIYTFNQVHQMISTISSELRHDLHPVDAIQSSFPMGSMTGAPKVSAMKLIEKYELTKRGVYSGAVGYFTPNGDFDFNVVIRSLLYNATKKYLSFMVGGAITTCSVAENEYEECLLKAKAIAQTLNVELETLVT